MRDRRLPPPSRPIKGRGAISNAPGRFEAWRRERDAEEPPLDPPRPETQVTAQRAKSIVARNDSPDVPFDRSINPYQGCEHGCVYCYARPAHAYLGLSPGLDFETRIFAKTNAADLLIEEFSRPGYGCEPVTIGGNTDPYQHAERHLGITRSVIQVLHDCRHPFSIITKSALIERDLDLLAPMAAANRVHAYISITSLDNQLARRLEPRAAAPYRRLESIRRLAEAGVPVGVMVAPVIPWITDRYLEEILEAARAAGAGAAGYVLLRLPHEVAPLFKEWLEAHFPMRAKRVLERVRDMREGKDYDTRWHLRQTGTGEYAQLLAQRFEIACRRFGLDRPLATLDASGFTPPRSQRQMQLL
jgi:DNA repair photolyase